MLVAYSSHAQDTLVVDAQAPISSDSQTASSEDNRIDLSGNLAATQEEIATIQVLSEICPQIIGKNKNFDAGYQRLLADFLPFPDPKLALRALNEEANYTAILEQTRLDTAQSSQADNRQVCLDVINWR